MNSCELQASVVYQCTNLDLILTGKSNLLDKLADVLSLVTLQLNHLTVLGMFYHSTVASKLLWNSNKKTHQEHHYLPDT